MPLEHIVIIPIGGIGNRLRTIACARRIAERVDARCTIGWSWGQFTNYFRSESSFDICSPAAFLQDPRYQIHRHDRTIAGQDNFLARRVDVAQAQRVVIISGWLFGSTNEPEQVREDDLIRWFLQPAQSVQDAVDRFASSQLNNAVGFHLRRIKDVVEMPVEQEKLFVEHMRRYIAAGFDIYIASDSAITIQRLKETLNHPLTYLEKTDGLNLRWPRPRFHAAATLADVTDFFILTRCRFIVGSKQSSFSRLACLYNGSPRCMLL